VRRLAGVRSGLSAAADATAGAVHHLDEMIGRDASNDLFHQELGACQAAGDSYLCFEAFIFIKICKI